jgi:hypothetical protein
MNIDYDKLKRYVTSKWTYYIIPERLNIIGIRATNQNAGSFDDILCTMSNDLSYVNNYQVTVDPSDLALVNMKNTKGVAIAKANIFYKDIWSFGFHKQDKTHPALVQVNPITVIRDFNKDTILNYNKIEKFTLVESNGKTTDYYDGNKLVLREEIGLFGINCHRASSWKISEKIGLYSEGCTVHKDVNRYNKEFIPTIKKYADIINKFSYLIINEDEYNKF